MNRSYRIETSGRGITTVEQYPEEWVLIEGNIVTITAPRGQYIDQIDGHLKVTKKIINLSYFEVKTAMLVEDSDD